MVYTGFHGLIGLFQSQFFKHHSMAVGCIFGTLFPDCSDIFLSLLSYYFRGYFNKIWDIDYVMSYYNHYATHSILVYIWIAIYTIIFSWLLSSISFRDGTKTRYFGIGAILGCFTHIVFDFFLFKSIPIFWPITSEKYSYSIFYYIFPWTSKIFIISEFLFDIIFLFIFIRICRKYQIHKLTYRIFSIIASFEIILFIICLFFLFNYPEISVNNLQTVVFYIHSPFIISSTIAPCLMFDVIPLIFPRSTNIKK